MLRKDRNCPKPASLQPNVRLAPLRRRRTMNVKLPIPGDLIVVQESEWYVLP